MNYYLKWSERAVESLELIEKFISQVSVSKAERVTGDIVVFAKKLELFPLMGKLDCALGDDVRKLIKDDYFIVYRVQDNMIYIIDVLCSKQDFIFIYGGAQS